MRRCKRRSNGSGAAPIPCPARRPRSTKTQKALPKVVSRDEWLTARNALLIKEKQATQARDALNAERRRLPIVKIEKDYVFEGPDGKASLLGLFEGRRQLIIYHSFFVDQICHLAHLHARDTSFALVSRAPLAKIKPFKKRMGWTVPWFSSFGTDFNHDFGVTTDEGETFGLSVFIRDGKRSFTPTLPMGVASSISAASGPSLI